MHPIPTYSCKEQENIEDPFIEKEKEEVYKARLYLNIFPPIEEENPLSIITAPKLTKQTKVKEPTGKKTQDANFSKW